MARTLQRRTVGGTNIPPTSQLKVKLSPTGRAFWASTGVASTIYRRIWNGTEYATPSGANDASPTLIVAWTADETYQVAIGRVATTTTTIFLRSFDITTGANVLLNTVSNVLNNGTGVLGIERISGDTFIASTQTRLCVFRIDRGTNTIVVLSDIAAPMTTIRGIAASGNDNIIIVHSGASDAENGLQSYSVDLSTGVLSSIGTKYIPGDGRINGFDFRAGKVLTHSFYNLLNVLYLQLNGSDALEVVPGFNATTLQNNMDAAGAQNTTSFIHLGFNEEEITYLDQTNDATFWSANQSTLTKSTSFTPPPDIPTGATNGRQNGALASRLYASYSDDGKVMAVTFWTAAALQGVYVYAEYDEVTAEFVAAVPMADAIVTASVNESAQIVADVPMATARVDLVKNSTVQLIASVPMAEAFVDADNTISSQLIADVPMVDVFIRDQGPRKGGIMVVQAI